RRQEIQHKAETQEVKEEQRQGMHGHTSQLNNSLAPSGGICGESAAGGFSICDCRFSICNRGSNQPRMMSR
ncbi:MAG TPA: hypothetical protein VEJ00_10790, partial [Candidatus Acidoferrales bacterium]|nr:hypothetical protein [Candidatus Acidoferrales bacterium]